MLFFPRLSFFLRGIRLKKTVFREPAGRKVEEKRGEGLITKGRKKMKQTKLCSLTGNTSKNIVNVAAGD